MSLHTLQNIHWLAVLLGTLAYFGLGAIWYSKALFANKWIEYCRIDINDPNAKKGAGVTFGVAFICMFLSSAALAVLAWKMQSIGWINGAKLGLFTGIFLATTAIAISYLFEKRPWGLYLINGGYTIIGSMLAGIIICAMR